MLLNSQHFTKKPHLKKRVNPATVFKTDYWCNSNVSRPSYSTLPSWSELDLFPQRQNFEWKTLAIRQYIGKAFSKHCLVYWYKQWWASPNTFENKPIIVLSLHQFGIKYYFFYSCNIVPLFIFKSVKVSVSFTTLVDWLKGQCLVKIAFY